MKEFNMLAKTYYGLEDVLAKELIELGADDVRIENRAVAFRGDLALMYKANICLRTAIRVLKPIATFNAKDAEEVYVKVREIDWSEWMSVRTTFLIDATVNSEDFRHSKFVSYRVKDAIADQFMELHGRRPSVRLDNPDLYINVHISHNTVTISLDSSGESLHRRGYRRSQNEAPIAEALAAGMLLKTGWDGKSDFVDPMCGSGTFLIEAALIALNIPPGIYRDSFAFEKWPDFDADLFNDIYNDDSAEREFSHKIYGFDKNINAVRIATENVKTAGLSKYIEIARRDIVDFEPMEQPCLMVTNPPYGERIITDDLLGLYRDLGSVLKHRFAGNTAWVISSQNTCLTSIGMKPSQKIEIRNGALECEFWRLDIFSGKRNEYVANKKGYRRN